MSDPAPARLHGLDAIRGIAALVVFIYHVEAGFQFPILFRKGYLAVDLFFLLSGYVLARTYEGRLKEGMGAAQLLAVRYRRLWPPMVVGCICGLPLLAIDADSWRTFALVAAANLFLLPMPIVGLAILPLNPPGWSIYFELLANLLHRALLGERRLLIVLVTSGVLFAYAAVQKGDANVGASIKNLVWGLPRVMFSYSLGILMWRRWRDHPPFRVRFPLVLVLVALCLPFAVDLLLIAVVFPLVIAGGLARNEDDGLSKLGAWSFPLYAVHGPIIDLAVRRDLGLGFVLPVVMVMSVLAFRLANRRWPTALAGLGRTGRTTCPGA